jgi:hypothetical protein
MEARTSQPTRKQAVDFRRDPSEWADSHIMMAIEPGTKLVISYHVREPTAFDATAFVRNLSERVRGRFQLTTHGRREHLTTVEGHFGTDFDFAQLVKAHGKPKGAGPDRYGPPEVIATIPTPIPGDPDPWAISTSSAEGANLSVRTHLRRFVRLTNGHSRKPANLKPWAAIYMAWFSPRWAHSTLKVTPAMESGLADHVWEIEDLLLA